MTTVLRERYELGASLGSGGMADVLEGYDRQLGRPVAVKILRSELPDPRARERFEHEARVAANFTHPNAVVVYDVGEDGQRPYIVMERVDGHSLADVLAERGPLDPEEAARITDQVLAALEAAHDQGLVHRDVKPGNVMLTGSGGVKLTDFGIAKAVSDASSGLTATGLVMGTPKYMAPEQAAGQGATPKSDLYAVGVMLYEMLAGEPPFTGDTPLAIAVAHQQAPVPPLGQRRAGLPAALLGTVDRALEKDPARRFPDARAMRAALEGDLAAATVPAAAAGAATEALPPTAPAPVPTRPASPRRRGPWVGLAVAALLLVGVAALAAWALSERDGDGDGGVTETTIPATQPPPTEPPETEAPTTTTTEAPVEEEPQEPQTVDELIAVLSSDPEAFGERGPELLSGLEELRPDPQQGQRAAKLMEDIDEWVADGELDPLTGEVARQILAPYAGQPGEGGGRGREEEEDD